MNTRFIPGPIDEQAKIENAITKTADYGGTTYDNGAGFAPGGLGMEIAVVIDVTTFALGGSTGASTWTAKIQDSADGNTWSDISASVTISSAGILSIGGFLHQRYSRLNLDVAGATGAGTISLTAYQVPLGGP